MMRTRDRRIGKTYRMMQEAIELANTGQTVYVIGSSARDADYMRVMAEAITDGKEPIAPIIFLVPDDFTGMRYVLVGNNPVTVCNRGDQAFPAFVDHFVYESGAWRKIEPYHQ